jgi:hypothetical protein
VCHGWQGSSRPWLGDGRTTPPNPDWLATPREDEEDEEEEEEEGCWLLETEEASTPSSDWFYPKTIGQIVTRVS